MRADAPTNTVIFDATTNLCRALNPATDNKDGKAKTYSSEEACNVDAIANVYDAQMEKDCGSCSNSAGAVVTAGEDYKGFRGTEPCITAQLACAAEAAATAKESCPTFYAMCNRSMATSTAFLADYEKALADSKKALATSNKAVADCKASKDHDKKKYTNTCYIIGGVAILLILIMGAVFFFTFRHQKHKLAVLEQQVPRSTSRSTSVSTDLSA